MAERGVAAGAKWCPGCQEFKSLDEFNNSKRSPDGKTSPCKVCARARAKAWREANPERFKECRNRCTRLAADRYADTKRRWLANNPDRRQAILDRYRERHLDSIRRRSRENARRYYWRSPDLYRRRSREWASSHRAIVNAMKRARHQLHPEENARWCARRYARIKGAPVIERFDRQEIYERDSGKCHVCKKEVPMDSWHLDHLIPLACGGEHSRRNVAVACPSCNCRRRHTGPAQLRMLP